jgi:hypothetical protein
MILLRAARIPEALMFRFLVVILVIAASLLWTTSTPTQADDLPFLYISLPPNVQSESVQISYFLVGPFGGYGGYVAPRFDVSAYQIPATVDDKRATELRAIVYASGCEIQEFVIPLTAQSPVSREFACQQGQEVSLSGQISPNELARYGNAELVITYMARWSHGFFGITDGPVTHFEIAKITPHRDGRFNVNLPMISREATHSEQASVCLMLRDSRTLNHIASNLEPDDGELKSEDRCLQIRTSYPAEINFTAGRFEKSNLKGRVFRSDSGKSIANSYILLENEIDQEKNFDTRTDEAGNYIFGHIPPGSYTVSIYAWFDKRDEVPFHNPLKQMTVDGGEIEVEWQWKSHAFMEIVRLKGVSIESDQEYVKDFDVVGK